MTKTSKILALSTALLAIFAGSGCIKKGKLLPPKENALRLALQTRVASLDPLIVSDASSHQAALLFYETLYSYHFLKRPYQLEPLLAESLPEFSKDRKTITIRLKKGVYFHDDPCFADGKGREMKADDVVYMIERACTPKNHSETYGSLEDRLVGAKEFFTGKAKTVEGVKKIDDYTVQFKLSMPLPRFIYTFSDSRTSIVPRECVEKYGDDFRNREVGTGPFLLKESNFASKIIAVRNPNYHHVKYPTEGNPGDEQKGLLADAGKDLPFVDRVQMELIPEPSSAWLKFLAGELDMARIPKDSVQMAVRDGKLTQEYIDKGIELVRQPSGDVTTLIFNMKDPIWGKNKKLRQAFALALNVNEIIHLQYGDQAIRAQSVIDPTQYGFESGFKSKWSERNIEKARQLLAEAGYPEGKGLAPVRFISQPETASRQLNELLSKQLKEVGISLAIETLSFPEMIRKVKETSDFTTYGTGFVSGSPDADDGLGLFHSKNILSGYNSSHYKNPLVDKLIDEIEKMDNGPARLKKIKEVQEVVDEDLPVITMVHRIGNQPAYYWLKNHVFIDNMFYGFLKFLRIQTAQ